MNGPFTSINSLLLMLHLKMVDRRKQNWKNKNKLDCDTFIFFLTKPISRRMHSKNTVRVKILLLEYFVVTIWWTTWTMLKYLVLLCLYSSFPGVCTWLQGCRGARASIEHFQQLMIKEAALWIIKYNKLCAT